MPIVPSCIVANSNRAFALSIPNGNVERVVLPDTITSLPKLLRATVPTRLSFYRRSTVDVSRDLIGAVLFHAPTAGMIVETEAYLGADDAAAHSSRGETERTRVIFGPSAAPMSTSSTACTSVSMLWLRQAGGCRLRPDSSVGTTLRPGHNA